MKQYIIRANNYQYNDENYYIQSAGGIDSVYNSAEEARKACAELSVEALGVFDQLFEFIFNCGNEEEKCSKIRSYYKTQFSIELDDTEPDMIEDVPLPEDATDEQLEAIIKILDIRFFEVHEIDSTASVYRITCNEDFWSNSAHDPLEAESWNSVYYGEEDVIMYLKDELGYAFDDLPSLQGGLSELSNTPDLLMGFLDGSKTFTYDEATKRITLLEHTWDKASATEIRALFNFLKQKPYHLIPMSIEEAKAFSAQPNLQTDTAAGAAPRTNLLQNGDATTQNESQSAKKWWQFWK